MPTAKKTGGMDLNAPSMTQFPQAAQDSRQMVDQALQPAMQCDVPLSLQAARNAAAPMDRKEAMLELTRCLILCAPSGMSVNERGDWLAVAWTEICDIPAAALAEACSAARKTVDHPAKLIPAIIREADGYAKFIKRRLVREEAAWANQNAPRLEGSARPSSGALSDREEVAALMGDLITELQARS